MILEFKNFFGVGWYVPNCQLLMKPFLLDGNGGMNIKIYHWPKLFILV